MVSDVEPDMHTEFRSRLFFLMNGWKSMGL